MDLEFSRSFPVSYPSFFCLWSLPIPTYMSYPTIFVTRGMALLLVMKRRGHTNRKKWIRTSFKQNHHHLPWFPLTIHWISLVHPGHFLLRPSTRLEILHERFPASVVHRTHPTQRARGSCISHRRTAFFPPSPRHFSSISSKLWWFFYLGSLVILGEQILCDFHSHSLQA